MKLTKTILARIWWFGRGTATVMGLAVLLALTVGLASTALAGTGVGARFHLGQTNTVDAVSQLVGTTTGPMLRISNSSPDNPKVNSPALDLEVAPGNTPMEVNSSLKVDHLNADQLDNRDASDFVTTFGKANDADRLDGRDSTAFFSGKTYNKEGSLVDNPGALRTASAACDAGDAALTGGYRIGSVGAEVEVVSEATFGGTHSVTFVADNTVVANVTCADFPPLR